MLKCSLVNDSKPTTVNTMDFLVNNANANHVVLQIT